MRKFLLSLAFLPFMASAYNMWINGFFYNFDTSAQTAQVTYGDSAYKGHKIIPSVVLYKMGHYTVTSIDYHAFWNDIYLESVTMPNSITSIGEAAFADCTGLTEVKMGSGLTEIKKFAFISCKRLKEITIPKNVTSIGYEVFDGCAGLTSMSVDSENTTFDSRKNCNAIIVTASDSLIYGCQNTVIPSTVKTIAGGAFVDCTNLTTLIIPQNVKSIGGIAFRGCTGLTEMYCYSKEVPYTIKSAFDASNIYNATLYVPEEAVEAYKAAEPWKYFGNIVAITGEIPVTPKCATPTISFVDGKLKFGCETEGVEYHYEFSYPEGNKGVASEVPVTQTINVSVYATKEDYDDSDVVTEEINIGSTGIRGDVNRDGNVNGTDIQEVINIIVNAD